ncbi:MAG: butyrate kinase [Lachnospirales bacterium]
MKILAINPGSTSTKISVFENENNLFTKNITHTAEHLKTFENMISQKSFRADEVKNALAENNFKLEDIDSFVGRGGLLLPIKSGTYNINEKMLEHLTVGISGEHASNLGGIIAKELATIFGKPSFIVDPVVVDEMHDVARISGIKGLERKSIFHALNQKAIAKKYAKDIGKNYNDLTVIVTHLGGGVSVGTHHKGVVIDVNNAIGGDGPFSPERAGTLPAFEFLKHIEGKDMKDIKLSIKGQGGLVSYFNTSDCREVEKLMQDGNEEAKLVLEAMAYSIAKEIGSMSTVVSGKVDAIILTGGIAYSKFVTEYISERVSYIAKVVIYPGENEMEALALGGLRVLNGEEKALEYPY